MTGLAVALGLTALTVAVVAYVVWLILLGSGISR